MNHCDLNRSLYPAASFLIKFVFVTIIFLAGAYSYAFAQTTTDVCRETQKIIDQDEREKNYLMRLYVIKLEPQAWQSKLTNIRGAVSGNYAVAGLDEIAVSMFFSSWNSIPSSTNERLSLQRNVLDVLERLVPEAQTTKPSDLQYRLERNRVALATRYQRMKDLNCAAVLAREKNAITSNLAGTWESTCCDGVYKGEFTLTLAGNKIGGHFGDKTNGTQGTIDGEVNGSTVTFTRKWADRSQTYNLTLSDDGKTLNGRFTGFKDPAHDTDFTATKKSANP